MSWMVIADLPTPAEPIMDIRTSLIVIDTVGWFYDERVAMNRAAGGVIIVIVRSGEQPQ